MFIRIGNTGQIINVDKVEKFTIQKDRLDVRFVSGHEQAYYRSLMGNFDELVGQVEGLLEEDELLQAIGSTSKGYKEYKYKTLEEK